MIYFLILNSVSGTVCDRAIICIGVSQTLLQFYASPPGIQAVVKKSTKNVPACGDHVGYVNEVHEN